jgi:hypothetical protein
MISFTTIPQTITAAVGAIALSAAFVAAASGPIQAAQLHPTHTVQVQA